MESQKKKPHKHTWEKRKGIHNEEIQASACIINVKTLNKEEGALSLKICSSKITLILQNLLENFVRKTNRNEVRIILDILRFIKEGYIPSN